MNKGIIFLNGHISKKLICGIDTGDSYIICADGAFKKVKAFIKPDVIVGDFDSLKAAQYDFSDIKSVRYPKEKNSTDGSLAILQTFKSGLKEVDIYGFSGGRADHFYNNFSYLAYAANLGISAKLVDGKFNIYYASDVFTASSKKGKIVSIVPFDASVHIIYTKGLKYPADGLILDKCDQNATEGISNIAISDVEIKLKGKALIFMQR